MEQLFDITFDMCKNAIDNTISNKIFVRNGIKEDNDIPCLYKKDQLFIINDMYFNNKNHSLIKPINTIEWLPKKLYQTAYYVVNLYGNYWIVSHSSYEGILVKTYITHTQYIENQFNLIKDLNTQYLEQIHWCSNNELFLGVQMLEQSPDKNIFLLIKHMTYPNSKIVIDHYLLKNEKKIYYFPFSNNYNYKPIFYKQL